MLNFGTLETIRKPKWLLIFSDGPKMHSDKMWVATKKSQHSHSISPEFIIYQIFLMISEFIKWDYLPYA